MADFIPWPGGEQPVGDDDLVEVQMPVIASDGTTSYNTLIRKASEFRWYWVAQGRGGDIVGYREVAVTPQ